LKVVAVERVPIFSADARVLPGFEGVVGGVMVGVSLKE
jgi:hypothetical protein